MGKNNNYTAPITLGFTPDDGDLIGGTVNGVEVSGEWDGGGVILREGALDVSTYDSAGGQRICIIDITDGQAQIGMESESAPTTDYELHLYRYTPADIVQIPQEYVEGLEDVAADVEAAQSTANEAKTAAETAQSTANSAKTTAETAQSTANSAKTAAETAQTTANAAKTAANNIKPDNNEMDETSPKYIANRPCYYAKTETRSYSYIQEATTLIEEFQLYWYGSYVNGPTITSGKKYRVGTDEKIYTCERYFAGANNYPNIIGNASLVASYLGITEPVPDTGEDWAYVNRSTSPMASMFAKTKSCKYRDYIYEVTDAIKKLDPILLPDEAVLPTVTASDSGKFLRVSSTGAWEAEEGMILNSSTSGSTKKFKITVDDTGAISATEVTT